MYWCNLDCNLTGNKVTPIIKHPTKGGGCLIVGTLVLLVYSMTTHQIFSHYLAYFIFS